MSYSLLIILLKSMSCIAISWNRQSCKITETRKLIQVLMVQLHAFKSGNHH